MEGNEATRMLAECRIRKHARTDHTGRLTMSRSTRNNRSKLTMTTFNIRGFRNKEEHINALRNQSHILGVCETWHSKKDVVFMHGTTEEVSVERVGVMGRPYGGVALFMHPLVGYQLVEKRASTSLQYITVLSAGIHLTTVYISPSATADEVTDFLERVHTMQRGKAVVMGDLNARHLRWDRKTTVRGRLLSAWADRNGWSIEAGDGPTCHTHRGGSSPDLFVYRGVKLSEVRIYSGTGREVSDHDPIQAELEGKLETEQAKRHLAIRHRCNKEATERAEKLYQERMPDIMQAIEKCTCSQELELLYGQLTNTLLEPWEPLRTRKPGRFRDGWTRELDNLAKSRAREYKRFRQSGEEEAKRRHERLDRQIKRLVRRGKEKWRARIDRTIKEAKEDDSVQRAVAVARILSGKAKKTNTHQIQPSDFTRRMATPSDKRWAPGLEEFEVPPEFERILQRSIMKAPKRKATGTDEIFVECLQVNAGLMSQVLIRLWRACSRLRYVPREWKSALLVPLFKKGDAKDVRNYRPVALLSHLRKVGESAIATLTRKAHTFDEAQLGFQEGTGTETAVVRHVAAGGHMNYCAVLDLKGAYDQVPRQTLMSELSRRLPASLAAMISYTLQPATVSTKGDKTGYVDEVAEGVPQGSPLSPTIFNVYMDTLAEEMKRKLEGIPRFCGKKQWDITIFADDVKLHARTRELLQRMLTIATNWAARFEMIWAPNKCVILTTPEEREIGPALVLANTPVKEEERATYLGMTITAKGVADTESVARISRATRLAHMLRAEGINTTTLSMTALTKVAKTIVLSIAGYAVHLVRRTERLKKEWLRMESSIASLVFGGAGDTQLNTVRALCRMPTLSEMVAIRMGGLATRIRKRAALLCNNQKAQDDTRLLRVAQHRLSAKDSLSRKCYMEAWGRRCRNRTRQIPNPSSGHAPAMHWKGCSRARMILRWYAGTFPANAGAVKRHADSRVRAAWGKLNANMRMIKWTTEERAETERAFAGIKARCVDRWMQSRELDGQTGTRERPGRDEECTSSRLRTADERRRVPGGGGSEERAFNCED